MSFEGYIDWEDLAINAIRQIKELKKKVSDFEGKEKKRENEDRVDWEGEYKKLKTRVETVITPLLVVAMKYVPEDEEDFGREDEDADWSDKMADLESGLPKLLTLCTPEERSLLFDRARKHIVDGKWVGPTIGNPKHPRPGLRFEPQLVRDLEKSGKTERKIRKNVTTNSRVIKKQSFMLTHLLLIEAKQWPNPYDVGSHLCHNRMCCDVTHFVWETDVANKKREVCRKKKVCSCGEKRKCMFGCN